MFFSEIIFNLAKLINIILAFLLCWNISLNKFRVFSLKVKGNLQKRIKINWNKLISIYIFHSFFMDLKINTIINKNLLKLPKIT